MCVVLKFDTGWLVNSRADGGRWKILGQVHKPQQAVAECNATQELKLSTEEGTRKGKLYTLKLI